MAANQEDNKWKRPKSVPIPTVWRKCTSIKKLADGKTSKFIIQDISEDKKEDVVDFMVEHFSRDETICQCLNLVEDPVSIEEFRVLWREMLAHNLGLVAYVEGEDGKPTSKIAGCNVTCMSYKSDYMTHDMVKGRVTRIIVRDILEYGSHIVDVFERYGVDEYMTAMGLCVDPMYRGQGLGLEILKARFDLGKAVGLKVTMTAFTGIASQIQAERAGFEVIAEIFYADFKDEDGNPV
uniref:Putative acetyltransferase n=1 Tax=Rhodnius prolixus TaxID=13249 RepID=R4FLD1_RHOPR